MHILIKLINLKSDMTLAEHFKSVSRLNFDSSLQEENCPLMRIYAQKMLVLSGSTYRCEQKFLVMKFNKSKNRSSLTDSQLSAVVYISTQDIQPDFDAMFKLNTDKIL